jgi:hypothetical protein
MTFLDFPTPFHLTREGRTIRDRIIRIARSPAVELSAAATIFFAIGFAAAVQI